MTPSDLLLELLVGFTAALGAQWLATHLAFRPVRRCPPDAHWSERARLSWSARTSVTGGPAAMLGITIVIAAHESHDLLGLARTIALPACVTLGAMCGSLPVARRLFRRRVTLRDLLSDYTVSFLVLAPASLMFMLMLLLLIGRRLDPTSIGIMIGAFTLALVLTFGAAVPLLRLLGLLRPPTPRLRGIVEETCAEANLPSPAVYMLHWHQANALAFPFAHLLAFTPPLVDILADEELRGVCAHELAHLTESARMKLTRLLGLLITFPAFTMPIWARSFGLPGLLIPFAILLIGGRLLRAFSQRMEKRADAAAHSHGGRNEGAAFARSLEKMHELNLMPAVLRGKRQTHPHLYDRLLAAGIEPTYPRPAAPGILRGLVALLLLVIGVQVPLAILGHSRAPEIEQAAEEEE